MALDAVLGTNQGSGTATTIALTTSAAVASGARVFLGVIGESVNTITVADNSGNGYTWTELVTTTKGGDHRLSLFTCPCASGLSSGAIITATYSGTNTGRAIGAISWAGANTSSGSTGQDTSSAKTENPGSTTWASANLVTTNAADLIIGLGAGYANGSPTSTAGAGYTEGFDVTVSGGQESISLVYQQVAATSTYNPGGTWTATPAEAIIVASAFKLTAGTTISPQSLYSAG